jgi:hypothetical protein
MDLSPRNKFGPLGPEAQCSRGNGVHQYARSQCFGQIEPKFKTQLWLSWSRAHTNLPDQRDGWTNLFGGSPKSGHGSLDLWLKTRTPDTTFPNLLQGIW